MTMNGSILSKILAKCSFDALRKLRVRVLLIVVVMGALTGQAGAQGINWRSDYNEARREAIEKGRPLIVDFVTEYCYYCKLMDDTTYKDPEIMRMLNEQFIPLKVVEKDNPQLVKTLMIDRFPTVVLAEPNGKILENQVGYKDPSTLKGYLLSALDIVKPSPEWAIQLMSEAKEAIKIGNFRVATHKLLRITQDRQPFYIQGEAGLILQNLEKEAEKRLTRSNQLVEQGQSSEAVTDLKEWVPLFDGTSSSEKGRELLVKLGADSIPRVEPPNQRPLPPARELVTQARRDYQTKNYFGCMYNCELVTSRYPGTPEADEAMKIVREVQNNIQWLEGACKDQSERLAGLLMALANAYLTNKQPTLAVITLERVIQAFPGTREAEKAQNRLSQINGGFGQPATQTNYKKPAEKQP